MQANSARSMPWPIPRTFGDASGNERRSTVTTAVQTFSAARTMELPFQCVYQRTSGIPSGHERRGEHRIERDHVRDDADRLRGRSSRASAAVNFAPRCACVRAPNSCARAFAGTASGTAESQSTTSSSTRAASARTIGTVAASTGSPGSSFCVAKISRRTVHSLPTQPEPRAPIRTCPAETVPHRPRHREPRPVPGTRTCSIGTVSAWIAATRSRGMARRRRPVPGTETCLFEPCRGETARRSPGLRGRSATPCGTSEAPARRR